MRAESRALLSINEKINGILSSNKMTGSIAAWCSNFKRINRSHNVFLLISSNTLYFLVWWMIKKKVPLDFATVAIWSDKAHFYSRMENNFVYTWKFRLDSMMFTYNVEYDEIFLSVSLANCRAIYLKFHNLASIQNCWI